MKKVSTASRVYQCANGEQVSMTFTANNTDMRITYRFDDEDDPHVVQGDTLTFTIDRPLRILRVFFHFINESGTGGFYDVRLRGSGGGDFPDPPPVRQAGDLVPVRRYAFILP